MADSSLPELTLTTSPTVSNYTYLAKDDGIDWYTDAKISLGTIKTFCSTSSTIDKTSDYIIDSEECDSQWFSNKGTAGYLIFTLPLAVEGYEVGFINESTYWIELKPNINDVIIPVSAIAGESIYGLNYGSTVYLRAIQDGWSVVYRYGTWNDTGSSSSSSSSSCSSSSSSSSSCSCSSSSSSSCSCSSSSCSCSSSSSLSSSSSSLSSSSLSSSSLSNSSSSSSFSSSSSSFSSSSSSCSSSLSSSSMSMSSSSSLSSSSSQDFTNTLFGGGYIP